MELDEGVNPACIVTSVVGFLVAAVGFLGVFPAIAISECEDEDGKKKDEVQEPTLCCSGA